MSEVLMDKAPTHIASPKLAAEMRQFKNPDIWTPEASNLFISPTGRPVCPTCGVEMWFVSPVRTGGQTDQSYSFECPACGTMAQTRPSPANQDN